MNPLAWKREHQIALVATTLLGFSAGLVVGYARDPHYGSFWDWLTTALNPNYPTSTGTEWSIFGALVGATIIYVVQLMRR
jgi:hypothetical protein